MKRIAIVLVTALTLAACDGDPIFWVIEKDVACCEGDQSACQELIDAGYEPSCQG
jgi:hypothetical protein